VAEAVVAPGLAPPQVTIATAGHVDHGKSSLVRALTGTDPDRLPEERARGMTIELGFAFMRGGDAGVDVAFIDCPGHERFVHHLVSGVGAVDGCVLVIAADEGPREQTREHLEILKLLQLRWGRVVLSKSDLLDAPALAAARERAAAFVAGTPLAGEPPLAVSARTGAGLDELRSWLLTRAAAMRRGGDGEHARLAVDRVFTLAGHGTVVTGTLRSGAIGVGDELELFPGGRVRVRSLQVDRRPVDRAVAGQRTAANLAGIGHAEVRRGAWLATPGALVPTLVADARLTVLPGGLAHRERVSVHHGTDSAIGRVHLLHAERVEEGEHDAQLRLESPLHLSARDLVVLRRASPSATVAGGVVVDALPPRHRRFSDAARAHFSAQLGAGEKRLLAHLDDAYPSPASREALAAWAGGPGPADEMIRAAGGRVVERQVGRERVLWSAAGWSRLSRGIVDGLAASLHGEPERCWHGIEELRTELAPTLARDAWDEVIAALVGDQSILRRGNVATIPGAVQPLPVGLRPSCSELLRRFDDAGLHPPYDHPAIAACADPPRAARALAALRERGLLLRLNDRLHLHRRHGEALVRAVAAATTNGGRIEVAWMKSTQGLSRRDAIPLFEWLDAIGVTQRVGDARLAGPARELTIPLLGEAVS
jgi:selenocysteine-specific elongation factor